MEILFFLDALKTFIFKHSTEGIQSRILSYFGTNWFLNDESLKMAVY